MYIKTQTTFGNAPATVFKSEIAKRYFYSLTSAADLIDKPARSVFEFLKTKSFKTSYGKEFTPFDFTDSNGTDYKLLPCDVVTKYIFHWAFKGHKLAQQLAEAIAAESLEIRAKVAFGDVTDAAVIATQIATDEELATRERRAARQEHGLFQKACLNLGFSPKVVHEYITKLVFGETAKEACQKPLPPYEDAIWSNPHIGINHHENPLLHQVYRDVKKAALSYGKGNYQERVDRAFLEVTNNLLLD